MEPLNQPFVLPILLAKPRRRPEVRNGAAAYQRAVIVAETLKSIAMMAGDTAW